MAASPTMFLGGGGSGCGTGSSTGWQWYTGTDSSGQTIAQLGLCSYNPNGYDMVTDTQLISYDGNIQTVQTYADWSDGYQGPAFTYYPGTTTFNDQFNHTFSSSGNKTIDIYGEFYTSGAGWGMYSEKQTLYIP